MIHVQQSNSIQNTVGRFDHSGTRINKVRTRIQQRLFGVQHINRCARSGVRLFADTVKCQLRRRDTLTVGFASCDGGLIAGKRAGHRLFDRQCSHM